MAGLDSWLIPQHDPTSLESRQERDRALQGLTELGIEQSATCPICLTNFDVDPADPSADERCKLSMRNRLFSCGCRGSKNQHIFHQYCLASHCCAELRRTGRANKVHLWEEQGVPCPICRGAIGEPDRYGDPTPLRLIITGMARRPAPEGGTKRRKTRKR